MPRKGRPRRLRQLRFLAGERLKKKLIRAYVKEAIELQRQGLEIKADRSKPLHIPPELAKLLGENKKLASAFQSLTKGKQREYSDYIHEAKRADTKSRRLLKIIPLIEAGHGLNDKYRAR